MKKRARRVVGLGLLAAVIAVWVVVLRPQALGGSALYIVVRGSSMLPTYETGDLVVVQSAAAYSVGDIVAYRVPNGEIGEGHLVIHRITGGDALAGYTVKGDNNSAVDPWSPGADDIAGRAWWVIPGLGRFIAFIHQPIIAAGLAAALMVTFMLARPSRPRAVVGRVPRRASRNRSRHQRGPNPDRSSFPSPLSSSRSRKTASAGAGPRALAAEWGSGGDTPPGDAG